MTVDGAVNSSLPRSLATLKASSRLLEVVGGLPCCKWDVQYPSRRARGIVATTIPIISDRQPQHVKRF